jgi:hypothetical protein
MFMYLGKASRVHFFFHIVASDVSGATLANMGGDLYNLMIKETMIEADDNLLVFNLLAVRIVPVCASHASFAMATFPANALERVLKSLLGADRTNDESFMVIAALMLDRQPVEYSLYEIPRGPEMAAILRTLAALGAGASPPLSPLQRVMSLKPIGYL